MASPSLASTQARPSVAGSPRARDAGAQGPLLSPIQKPGSGGTYNVVPITSNVPALLALITVVSIPILLSLAATASPQLLGPLLGFRGGPLTPQACQAPTKDARARGNLPTLFFIAGVEGAGHGYFTSLFGLIRERTNLTLEKFDPGLHVTAAEEQVMDPTKAGLKKWKGCPKLPYSRQVYDFGAEITARLAALQEGPGVPFRGLYVRSRDTSPLGGPMETPLSRPDLVALAMFHGIMYNLRVIAIVRDPVATMTDRIRNRTYSDDPGLLFRVTEDSLTYLDASLRLLPCGTYAAVNLDLIVGGSPEEGETAVAPKLAKFLGIDRVGAEEVLEVMTQARSLFVKPEMHRRMLKGSGGGREEAPKGVLSGNSDEDIKAWMKELEDKSSPRLLLWPLFTAMAGTAFFHPSGPGDWPSA